MGSLKHFYVVFSISLVFAVRGEGLSCINGDAKRLDNEKFLSCVAGTWVQKTYKDNDRFPLGENLNRTRRDVELDDAFDLIEDVSMTIKNGGRSKQKQASSVFPRKCGITNVTPDGGSTVEKTPWLVVIMFSGTKSFRCNGVIISKKYVLTSAQCANNTEGSSLESASFVLTVGVMLQERKPEYSITRVTIHPDYKVSNDDNGIALIEISGKFTFSNDIQPICMPYHELYKINRQGVFTYWSFWTIGLHRNVSYIISKAECRKTHNEYQDITAGMFCTTDGNNFTKMNGLVGGPFFVNEGARHYLLGVFPVQSRVYPLVFTKVISYMGWIKDVMTTQVSKDLQRVKERLQNENQSENEKPARTQFPTDCGLQHTDKTLWLVELILRWYQTYRVYGAIISKKYILTAAHDVLPKKWTSPHSGIWYIIVGDPALPERERTCYFTRIIVHPEYDSSSFSNDIALIEISSEFTFFDRFQPICMPYHELYQINRRHLFTANLFEVEPSPGFNVNVHKLVDNGTCSKKYNQYKLTTEMFCSVVESPFQPDFAGPLFASVGGRHYLLGLFSWHHFQFNNYYPRINTKVINYKKWIREVTGLI